MLTNFAQSTLRKTPRYGTAQEISRTDIPFSKDDHKFPITLNRTKQE